MRIKLEEKGHRAVQRVVEETAELPDEARLADQGVGSRGEQEDPRWPEALIVPPSFLMNVTV